MYSNIFPVSLSEMTIRSMRTKSFSRSRLVRFAFTAGGAVLPDEKMEVALRSYPFCFGLLWVLSRPPYALKGLGQ